MNQSVLRMVLWSPLVRILRSKFDHTMNTNLIMRLSQYVQYTATYKYTIIYCKICQNMFLLVSRYQMTFRNLTSDYTESCRWRSVNQEMWSRRCDTAETCEMRRFWRVGIARNVVFFHSFMALPSESQLLKTGGCGGSAAQDVAKICTTLWREGGSEFKIVWNWHDRGTFWSSRRQNLHLAVAPERFGSQSH